MSDDTRSLQVQIDALREALTTALAWMAQSANTPLRYDEVNKLIRMAEKGKKS